MDPDFLEMPAFLLSFNRLAVKISTFSLLTRCCVELSPVKTALFASDNDLWSTFASFLPLHEMQVFECTFPVCLSDERIESITLAWPNLERLVITPAAAWDILKIDPHTEATINSLSHFAQNCRKLEYLAVPVQVHSPLPDNLPDLTFFAHPLHTFKCTLPGDLVDLNGVAVRLDRVFPSLTHVSGNFRTSAWEEVTRIIREELQVVRAPARVDLGL
ncbi:hypothetical protein BT96DRAFT_652587 [Gymnopus androsaceus JB14]|uniref:F-box domain-containing protein n=1 Tax=Gymnopus androsaceus JB14 TaxID=1447944 RepID=A0A6A4HTK8_9AGAR|nr:hypothetical protein BT96DRAFT_652587 [Gymnopus androsaceus JB14]